MPGGPLVLASTSAARRALLERLGVSFDTLAPECDEERIRGATPADTARARAIAKAESVARSHPEATVLGSDQLVDLDGEIVGKPGTSERARAQLARLSGRAHRLVTAVALIGPGTRSVHVDTCTLRMRALGEDEIARYVSADAPEACAGSYRIESRGIALFEAIEGADHTAIVGLPLMQTAAMLRDAGWSIP